MIGGWTNIFKSNDLELYYIDFKMKSLNSKYWVILSEKPNSYITKEKEVL